jgi:hypothetical protein
MEPIIRRVVSTVADTSLLNDIDQIQPWRSGTPLKLKGTM